METYLCFTDNEIAVIDGVLAAICPRMPQAALQDAFRTTHEHLHEGCVRVSDLHRIISALELTDPCHCTTCSKESYREMTTLLLKTKAMLRAVL